MEEHITFNETLENNLKTVLNVIKKAGIRYDDSELLHLSSDFDLLLRDKIDILKSIENEEVDDRYEEGYDEGYEDGRKEGYEEGSSLVWEEAYNQGHDDGYKHGYSQGFEWV